MRWRLLLVALLAVLVVLAGCGDDDGEAGQPAPPERSAAPKGTFVGKVEGTDAYLALVSDGKRVLGYVCDSKRISTWIAVASVRDGKAKLNSRRADALGEATFSADGVSGELTVGGERRSFSAQPASGEAGLYRAAHVKRRDNKLSEGEVEAGWVVLPDGSQRGGVGGVSGSTTGDVHIKPAPRLAPNATNVNLTIAGNPTRLAVTNVRGITPIPIP